MFKYILAVSVLSTFALGQERSGEGTYSTGDYAVLDVDAYHPDSHSWVESEGFNEDLQAYCIQNCDRYCENCTEPNTCDFATEKWCKTLPVDPDMHHCRGDDVCVPHDCLCKHHDE